MIKMPLENAVIMSQNQPMANGLRPTWSMDEENSQSMPPQIFVLKNDERFRNL